MQSFIEDFQGDWEKDSDLVICLCGHSGAGKGTLGRFIAEELGISFYSAGDFFRDIAEEKGLTVEELSKKAEKETDLEVDRRTLEKGLNEDCVIESRISAWVLGSYADFSIYVTADVGERARRVNENADERTAEESDAVEKVAERIERRDDDNRRRYMEYYGVDMTDRSIFDLLIDNTDMSIEDQERLVKKSFRLASVDT